MSIFSISDTSQWLTAIADSQLGSPVYSTYQLTADITFSSSGQFYLSTGSSDSDYLYIGVGSAFDGNGYTITVNSGCEPATGLAGILRARGSSSSQATIKNVTVVGGSGLSFEGTYGALVVSTISTTIRPSYITFLNCIVTTASVATSGFAVVLNNQGSGNSSLNTQFNNVALFVTVPFIATANAYFHRFNTVSTIPSLQ